MNSGAIQIDAADYRILSELSEDGRASDVSIGERINLSSSAVARRRKIMEEIGIISGYNAKLDMTKLGFSGVVIVFVELTSQVEEVLNAFESQVLLCPSISYCGFISGENDFMMVLHVSSFNDYDKIYRKELSVLPHVARIRSSFVLREVARRINPPAVLQVP